MKNTIKTKDRIIFWMYTKNNKVYHRIDGLSKPLLNKNLASLETLREDYKKRKSNLSVQNQSEKALFPWDDRQTDFERLFIIKEGAYIWNFEKQDYQKVFIKSIYQKTNPGYSFNFFAEILVR